MTSVRSRRSLVLIIALALALGIGGGATYAAFSSTTTNNGNSLGVTADFQAPTVSKAVIAKLLPNTQYLDSAIRQGQTFYVYANVTDNGNPASGVASVSAAITNVSLTTPVALTTAGCPCSVMGTSYNYRSASVTARAVLAGDQTWSITATDNGGYPATFNSAVGGPIWTVNADNTVPVPVVATTVATNGGATAGRIETGDVITYSWNDRIDPQSIRTGWNGSGTIAATVTVTNAASNDTIQVNVGGGTANIFGTVSLAGNYATATSSPAATIAMSADFTQAIVTLTANPTNPATVASSTPIWARTTTIWDDAGNTMTAGNTTLSTRQYF